MHTILTRRYLPVSDGPKPILTRLAMFWSLFNERRDLEKLDDRMLQDIGVTPDDVRRETRRAVWDVPKERDFGGRYGPG